MNQPLALNNYLGRLFSGLFFISGVLFYLSFQPDSLRAAELKLLIGQEEWSYKEVDDWGGELNREQGTLSQIQASLLLPTSESLTLHSSVTYNKGRLTYIGRTQAGSPHTTLTNTSNLGLDLTVRSAWRSMYFGTGLRAQAWQRGIQAENNISHLNERYRWLGPQLEFGYFLNLNDKLKLELGLSRAWLFGDLEVDLTQVPGNNLVHNFGKPKLKLKSGHETKAAIALVYQLKQRTNLFLEYQKGYRYFPKTATTRASDGSIGIVLHEPKSTNDFYYYSAGMSYKF